MFIRNGCGSKVPPRLRKKVLAALPPQTYEAATIGQLPLMVPVSVAVRDTVQSLVPDMIGVICGRTHRNWREGGR
jgi:hypothetical protein